MVNKPPSTIVIPSTKHRIQLLSYSTERSRTGATTRGPVATKAAALPILLGDIWRLTKLEGVHLLFHLRTYYASLFIVIIIVAYHCILYHISLHIIPDSSFLMLQYQYK